MYVCMVSALSVAVHTRVVSIVSTVRVRRPKLLHSYRARLTSLPIPVWGSTVDGGALVPYAVLAPVLYCTYRTVDN